MKSFRKLLVTCLLCLLFGVAHADVVDINSANTSVLAANISGIGPTRAEAIVAYRNVNRLRDHKVIAIVIGGSGTGFELAFFARP